MDPITFAQLNAAYHKGVYGQGETLDIQEWVEALIEEGYDLDEYTDDELYEAYLADLEEATVLSVSSPGGKKRTLNVTKAKPARNLSGSEWHDAAKTSRDLKKQREASSFSPQAERAARTRGQEQVSRDRQSDQNMRIRFATSALRRRFGIPDSALDPADRSKDIPKRSVSLREELDLYDLVSEYLVSEGFCDSYEDADVIMANMSEEWRNSILDEARREEGEEDWRKSEIRDYRRHELTGTATPSTDRMVSHFSNRGVKKAKGSKVPRRKIRGL
jgi:hypothetical protein